MPLLMGVRKWVAATVAASVVFNREIDSRRAGPSYR
jgi:hypothetical protein